MQDAIRLDVFYPHPRERVWRALTDPEALSEWLMPTDFAPRVGHRFTFRTEPERGWSGLVRCEVLELEEPWKLSYSWWGHPRVPTTLVSYRLVEEGDGTRLLPPRARQPDGPRRPLGGGVPSRRRGQPHPPPDPPRPRSRPDRRTMTAMQRTTTPITRIRLCGVNVSDQDRAIEFYTQTLGFELRDDTEYGEGRRWVEVFPPNADAGLTLFKPWSPEQGEPGGDTSVIFACNDIEAGRAELESRGVQFDGPIFGSPPSPPMTFFLDPDGNKFLLVQK